MNTVVDIKSGGREDWHRLQLVLYLLGEPDPEIEFSEEGHRYRWRSRELLSVTKIVGKKNAYYRPGSAERGRRVHKMCALDAQSILDEATIDPSERGYLAAFRRWWSNFNPELIAIEQIVGSPSLGFAGRLDMVIRYDGGPPGLILYLNRSGEYNVVPIDKAALPMFQNEALRLLAEAKEKEGMKLWGST